MKHLYIVIIAIVIIFSSCEERIYIPLNTIDDLIVIEANVSDKNDSVTVMLSKTTDYYKPEAAPTISDANILLYRESGDTIVLNEIKAGYYSAPVTDFIDDEEFTLDVFTNGITYSATSTMPAATDIQSVIPFVIPKELRFMIENPADTLTLVAFFQDSLGYENYYRLRAYENDTLVKLGYEVMSDEFQDGIYTVMDFTPADHFYSTSDTVTLELLAIDSKTYLYFLQLFDSKNAESSGIPYNPDPQFTNGALGYFSAYRSRKKTIEINNFLTKHSE